MTLTMEESKIQFSAQEEQCVATRTVIRVSCHCELNEITEKNDRRRRLNRVPLGLWLEFLSGRERWYDPFSMNSTGLVECRGKPF